MPRADPVFEVRGGGIRLENLKTGGCISFIKYTYFI